MAVSTSTIASSAPGKVFFAGGYLALERKHTAFVLGLDARIHTIVRSVDSRSNTGELLAASNQFQATRITVKSPQFTQAQWEYDIEPVKDGGGIRVRWIEPSSESTLSLDAVLSPCPNDFVQTTLSYVLSYLSSTLPSGPRFPSCEVTILADTSYYTLPATSISTTSSPNSRFHNFGIPLSAANKTGLGSSAALVTSLTASILRFYSGSSVFSRDQLHNLAQAAHCAAQGKVGSGFDVAAAVYGTCLYRRFSPSILDPNSTLSDGSAATPESPGFSTWLASLINDQLRWDTEIDQGAAKIPPGLQLVLCDVDCGSKTPGMVREVLKWKKEAGDEGEKLWDDIQRHNDALRTFLIDLYDEAIAKKRPDGEVTASAMDLSVSDYAVIQVREQIEKMRRLTRVMTASSGVPIEPSVQTRLLDALTTQVQGVVGGVVPGAGGFDAIALLVRSSPTPEQGMFESGGESENPVVSNLRKFLSTFDFFGGGSTDEEGVLGSGIGKVNVLSVQHDNLGGLVEEDKVHTKGVGMSLYEGWI